MRISDAERDEVLERIRDAYAHGCLDHGELEARLDLAHTARTRGEVAVLTKDLPAVSHRKRHRSRVPWTYLEVNGVLWGIWGAQEVAGHGPQSFWPLFVSVPWGVLVVVDALRAGGRRVRRARP